MKKTCTMMMSMDMRRMCMCFAASIPMCSPEIAACPFLRPHEEAFFREAPSGLSGYFFEEVSHAALRSPHPGEPERRANVSPRSIRTSDTSS